MFNEKNNRTETQVINHFNVGTETWVNQFELDDYTMVTVITTPEGRWVPIEPLSEQIGINPKKQVRKVINDPRFDVGLFDQKGNLVDRMVTDDDGNRVDRLETIMDDPSVWVCVDEEHLGRWLFSINHRRISAESSTRLGFMERWLLKGVYTFEAPDLTELVETEPEDTEDRLDVCPYPRPNGHKVLTGVTVEYNPERCNGMIPWRATSEIGSYVGQTLEEVVILLFERKDLIHSELDEFQLVKEVLNRQDEKRQGPVYHGLMNRNK